MSVFPMTIVVATDGSAEANVAVQTAAELVHDQETCSGIDECSHFEHTKAEPVRSASLRRLNLCASYREDRLLPTTPSEHALAEVVSWRIECDARLVSGKGKGGRASG